jgi:NDP-sugar pyrophosphorylase family protein
MNEDELKNLLSPVPFLVLVGGLGSRLGDNAVNRAKCMVDVAGEPFVSHMLKLLKEKGVQKVVLLTGHKGEQIRNFVKEGKEFDLDVTYSDDGESLLGTGGAVKKAASELCGRVAVMYGDSYLDIPMSSICQRFEKCPQPALMTVIQNHEAVSKQKSNVAYDPKRTLIKAYSKKNPTDEMTYIDYGLSFFDAEVLKKFDNEGEFDLAEIFTKLSKSSQLAGYEVQRRFYDINTPESLIETRASLSRNSLW